MDNINTCPQCDAEIRDGAKFCDECGATIGDAAAAAPVQEAAAPKGGANWLAIVVVVLVIAVIWWMLSRDSGEQNTTTAAMGDNPHNTGADMENPHAAGGDDEMGQMMSQIAEAKAQLEEDPLNIQMLGSLYQTYGMVGETAKLRVYFDNAMAAVEEQQDELGDDVEGILMDLGRAAVGGGDLEAGMEAFNKLRELRPDSTLPLKMIADMHASMGDFDQALSAYDEFLAASEADQGEDYWVGRINKGMVYFERYRQAIEGEENPADLTSAVATFREVTEENKFLFDGFFALGDALEEQGDIDGAINAWEKAASLAQDAESSWRAESKIAIAKGEEPPEPPASMMPGMGGMGGMGGGGMANPHGGDMGGGDTGGTGGDMANPHGGM